MERWSRKRNGGNKKSRTICTWVAEGGGRPHDRGARVKRSCLSVKIAGTRRRLSSYQSDGRRYLRRRLRSLHRRPCSAPIPVPGPRPVFYTTAGSSINRPPAKHNIHPYAAAAVTDAPANPFPFPTVSFPRENSSILFLLSLIFRVYRCHRSRPFRREPAREKEPLLDSYFSSSFAFFF